MQKLLIIDTDNKLQRELQECLARRDEGARDGWHVRLFIDEPAYVVFQENDILRTIDNFLSPVLPVRPVDNFTIVNVLSGNKDDQLAIDIAFSDDLMKSIECHFYPDVDPKGPVNGLNQGYALTALLQNRIFLASCILAGISEVEDCYGGVLNVQGTTVPYSPPDQAPLATPPPPGR